MKRAVIAVLILIAGRGEQLAYAGCHQVRARRVVVARVVQPYVAPVYAQRVLYSVGPDYRDNALVERVTANLMARQLEQQQQENLRLRQQLQQAYTAPQPQYSPRQEYTAPQPQTGGAWRWKGGGEIYQDGSLPAGPGPGTSPSPGPGDQPDPPPQVDTRKAGVTALFQKSCIQCHRGATAKAGVDLSGDPDLLDPLVKHKVLLQMDLDLMPPRDMKNRQRAEDHEVENYKYWLGRIAPRDDGP